MLENIYETWDKGIGGAYNMMDVYADVKMEIKIIKEHMKNPYYSGITIASLNEIEDQVKEIVEGNYFSEEDYLESIAKLEGILSVLEVISKER